MSNQEIRIVTKIVNELTHFFLLHGHKKIKIETYHEDEATLFVITVEKMSTTLAATIKKKVDRERWLEIETYGWELIGDIDSKSELEIVGHLIDEVHIKHDGAKSVVTLVRKNRYRKKK